MFSFGQKDFTDQVKPNRSAGFLDNHCLDWFFVLKTSAQMFLKHQIMKSVISAELLLRYTVPLSFFNFIVLDSNKKKFRLFY